MDYALIAFAAAVASLLTFFSGFGLGTMLTPVFAIFFPIDVAVALTGIVHLLNNIFKMGLIGRNINWKIALKFGIPAMIAAYFGARLLLKFSAGAAWHSYQIGSATFEITPAKVIIGMLMLFFALFELLPALKRIQFSENKLYIGGAISGFFGGLSGHQGALRSAFLLKCGLSKESFVATGIVIAVAIDITRLSTYFSRFAKVGIEENLSYLAVATGAAFVGAIFGRKLLKKVTLDFVQTTVSIMLIGLALLLGFGII